MREPTDLPSVEHDEAELFKCSACRTRFDRIAFTLADYSCPGCEHMAEAQKGLKGAL